MGLFKDSKLKAIENMQRVNRQRLEEELKILDDQIKNNVNEIKTASEMIERLEGSLEGEEQQVEGGEGQQSEKSKILQDKIERVQAHKQNLLRVLCRLKLEKYFLAGEDVDSIYLSKAEIVLTKIGLKEGATSEVGVGLVSSGVLNGKSEAIRKGGGLNLVSITNGRESGLKLTEIASLKKIDGNTYLVETQTSWYELEIKNYRESDET